MNACLRKLYSLMLLLFLALLGSVRPVHALGNSLALTSPLGSPRPPAKKDLGKFAGTFSAKVSSHGVVMLRVAP